MVTLKLTKEEWLDVIQCVEFHNGQNCPAPHMKALLVKVKLARRYPSREGYPTRRN